MLSKKKQRIPKRISGKSIEVRPAVVDDRNTFGHWEGDTVLGRKVRDKSGIFTLVEQLTGCCISLQADGKSLPNIIHAMKRPASSEVRKKGSCNKRS